jgi:hypothetical protein
MKIISISYASGATITYRLRFDSFKVKKYELNSIDYLLFLMNILLFEVFKQNVYELDLGDKVVRVCNRKNQMIIAQMLARQVATGGNVGIGGAGGNG